MEEPMTQVINNYTDALTAAIGPTDTDIDVGIAPSVTVSADDALTLTLYAAGVLEIVKVTGINGTTLTVERAQEGTVARAWALGTALSARLTRQTLLDLLAQAHHVVTEITSDITISGGTSVSGTGLGLLAAVGESFVTPNGETREVATIVDADSVTITSALTDGTQTGTTSRVNSVGDRVTLVQVSPPVYGLRA